MEHNYGDDKKIAEKVPEIMYAGWDIALSKTGKVVLIEGNSHAMMFNQQQADLIGKWPLYKTWLRETKN